MFTLIKKLKDGYQLVHGVNLDDCLEFLGVYIASAAHYALTVSHLKEKNTADQIVRLYNAYVCPAEPVIIPKNTNTQQLTAKIQTLCDNLEQCADFSYITATKVFFKTILENDAHERTLFQELEALQPILAFGNTCIYSQALLRANQILKELNLTDFQTAKRKYGSKQQLCAKIRTVLNDSSVQSYSLDDATLTVTLHDVRDSLCGTSRKI